MITDIASHFIAQSRGFLSSDYLQKIERCLEILSDEEVWFQVRASRRPRRQRRVRIVCESCGGVARMRAAPFAEPPRTGTGNGSNPRGRRNFTGGLRTTIQSPFATRIACHSVSPRSM